MINTVKIVIGFLATILVSIAPTLAEGAKVSAISVNPCPSVVQNAFELS